MVRCVVIFILCVGGISDSAGGGGVGGGSSDGEYRDIRVW